MSNPAHGASPTFGAPPFESKPVRRAAVNPSRRVECLRGVLLGVDVPLSNAIEARTRTTNDQEASRETLLVGCESRSRRFGSTLGAATGALLRWNEAPHFGGEKSTPFAIVGR